MNRPTNDDIHDLVAAYALDAVDDLERVRFEAHLARCPACRRDLDEYREVAGMLAAHVAAEPPPTLRAAVLSEIGQTPQARPLPSAPSRSRRWVTAGLSVAAAMILAVLAVRLVSVGRQRDEAMALNRVLTAADAEVMALHGDHGSGRLVFSPSVGRMVVVLDGLGDMPADRVLQLWYQVDGAMMPGATFAPTGGRVVAAAGTLMPGTHQFAVTVEPVGGSPTPTGDVMMSTDRF